MPGKYVLDHIMPAGRLSGIEEKVQMTTTATPPQAIQVSVLRWALEEAGWPYCENVVSPAD